MQISIVTIVRNRHAALLNLIKGLSGGTVFPAELVIIHMNEDPYDLPPYLFPVNQVVLASEHKLPLAAARNLALNSAKFEKVIFLDADCIPEQKLVETYKYAFEFKDVLWAGKIRYLPADALEVAANWQQLNVLSKPDKIRGNLNTYSYELFWSLNFGCSKDIFHAIGGFDESFTGYGAEDTDFAFSARKRGISLETIDTTAYHQHHPSYDPPVNHLQDIIANASYFKSKWNVWPMEGWLKKFETAGLIRWEDNAIKLLRSASAEEIEAAFKEY